MRRAHPDKGGTAKKFNQVTENFKKLAELRAQVFKDEPEVQAMPWSKWFYGVIDCIKRRVVGTEQERQDLAPQSGQRAIEDVLDHPQLLEASID